MTILLVGCTGFLGEAIIYKLLVKTSYNLIIIIRRKNNMSVSERLNNLFESVKLLYDDYKDRIKAIEVKYDDQRNIDIEMVDLLYIKKHTTVLVNALADVNMNRDIRKAALNNTVTAVNWMKLFQQCLKGQLYLYISTCYVNFHRKDVGDIPEKIMETTMSKKTLTDILDKKSISIGNYENTYVYTKQLAEVLLNSGKGEKRLAIIRPSIIIPAIKSPYSGWGKMQTISYAILGISSGLLSVVRFSNDKIMNTVPVDIVAEDCMVVINEKSTKQLEIRHCCLTGNLNKWYSRQSAINIRDNTYNYFVNYPISINNKTLKPYKLEYKDGLFHLLTTLFFHIIRMFCHWWSITQNPFKLFNLFYKNMLFTYYFDRHLIKFVQKKLIFKRELKENDIKYPNLTFEQCYFAFTKNLQNIIDNDDSISCLLF